MHLSSCGIFNADFTNYFTIESAGEVITLSNWGISYAQRQLFDAFLWRISASGNAR